MIQRFRKVTDKLYRGSAPTPKDVQLLHDNLGIKKIVSLDDGAGKKISRVCKLLGIQHIILPLKFSDFIETLHKFLNQDLKEIFLENGPTFVHCLHGKDRTGLAIALVECKYLGKDPEDAIKEAESLGFGVGVNPAIISLFKKIIRKSSKHKDENSADIVSNEREYIGDNRDSFLDEGHLGSFAPYLSVTRQNPMDSVYNFIMDQSPTRENYHIESIKKNDSEESDVIPMIGIYNNDAGIHGAGPAEPVGGFIYD